MSRFVVCLFDSETAAREGLRSLKQLHGEGCLAVFSRAVVVKTPDGGARVVDKSDQGPVGLIGGLLIGSLAGVLAGPSGMVAAGVAGGLCGWLVDRYNRKVDARFLNDVCADLPVGKSALVAEIGRGWTSPLEARVHELGGRVLHSCRVDVEDRQIKRDYEAARARLQILNQRLRRSVARTQETVNSGSGEHPSYAGLGRSRADKASDSVNSEAAV